jgi:signal transduction histidine kinase
VLALAAALLTDCADSQIRTPLNAMSGAAALLADTSPLNDEQRSLLELLDAGVEHVIVIIGMFALDVCVAHTCCY